MKKTLLIALTFYLCHSCKQIQYIPIETTKTEYRNNHTRDSIFQLDSIIIKEKGDTVIVEHYRYFYKDKIIHDSIHINDTTRIPYPVEVIKETKKPLTRWQNFQLWCGRFALLTVLFFIIYVSRKLKKKRPF